jgi:hypothetical protein
MTQTVAKTALKRLEKGESIPFVALTMGFDTVAFTWWVMEAVPATTYARYVCRRMDFNTVGTSGSGLAYRQRMGKRSTCS